MINFNNSRLSGYLLGLRQPSIQLSLQLDVPEIFDFDYLKAELYDRFQIEHEELKSRIKRELNQIEKSAVEFAWQTIGLTCNLLQTIKIPSFDRGIILDIYSINEQKNRYLITVQFPFVDHHPFIWIERCMTWAQRLTQQLIQSSTATEEKIDEILEELHENFINEARKQVSGGGSTVPFLKTAYEAGIPFKHISWGIYQLGWSNNLHITHRSSTELDSAIGANMSHNKFQAAHLFKLAGLPAPVHYLVGSAEHAIIAAKKLGYPVVVKPADKDRGEGVTVNIYDEEGVKEAYGIAYQNSNKILIEKQVSGICYRILVVGEKALYTVARMPIAVVGDGIHSIDELILQSNEQERRKAKHLRQKLFPSDDLAVKTLENQGFQLTSIPNKGVFAQLRPIETTEWGGLPKVFSQEIHSENIRVIVQAAKILNLYTAGVDFITEDITKPWYQNGAIINEVNFAPFLGTKYEYQRAGVQALVQILFPKGGRIPIEVYIGDDQAWSAATKRQNELIESGIHTFVSSHCETLGTEGSIHLASVEDSLYQRVEALLMNRDVCALLLVVQTDEFLDKGLPVDSVNSVTVVNKNIKIMVKASQVLSEVAADMLTKLFAPYLDTGHVT